MGVIDVYFFYHDSSGSGRVRKEESISTDIEFEIQGVIILRARDLLCQHWTEKTLVRLKATAMMKIITGVIFMLSRSRVFIGAEVRNWLACSVAGVKLPPGGVRRKIKAFQKKGDAVDWIEISVNTVPEDVPAINAMLGGYAPARTAVESVPGETRSWVRAYLPASRSDTRLKSEIQQNLEHLFAGAVVSTRVLRPDDWLGPLKTDFGILEVGHRFLIKPAWIHETPASDRLLIELDPGVAFGTGVHPTTRLCLINLEKLCRPGMVMLDLGTGTGILAIAAAKLGAATVLGLDNDWVAVNAARRNVAANRVNRVVRIKHGTLNRRTLDQYLEKFDLAVANITAQAIIDVAPLLVKVLNQKGILIVSGFYENSLDELLISLAVADFHTESIHRDSGWYAVVAGKMNPNKVA